MFCWWHHHKVYLNEHVCVCLLSCFSCVWFFVTPWTVTPHVPLSVEFSRQVLEWVAMPFSRGSWLAPKKVTVTVLWSAAHLIHYSFLNPYETVISEKYIPQINEMHQKLQCPQPALVNRKGPILLQDNAWLHIEQQTLQQLNELG